MPHIKINIVNNNNRRNVFCGISEVITNGQVFLAVINNYPIAVFENHFIRCLVVNNQGWKRTECNITSQHSATLHSWYFLQNRMKLVRPICNINSQRIATSETFSSQRSQTDRAITQIFRFFLE